MILHLEASPISVPGSLCVCVLVQAKSASSLLADSFAPVEWAVFRHTTQLLRDALHADTRAANGLTPSSVAALLAELWFPPLPLGFGAAGQFHRLDAPDVPAYPPSCYLALRALSVFVCPPIIMDYILGCSERICRAVLSSVIACPMPIEQTLQNSDTLFL